MLYGTANETTNETAEFPSQTSFSISSTQDWPLLIKQEGDTEVQRNPLESQEPQERDLYLSEPALDNQKRIGLAVPGSSGSEGTTQRFRMETVC